MQSPRSSLPLPPNRTFAPGHDDCGKTSSTLQPDKGHAEWVGTTRRRMQALCNNLSDVPGSLNNCNHVRWHYPFEQIANEVATAQNHRNKESSIECAI